MSLPGMSHQAGRQNCFFENPCASYTQKFSLSSVFQIYFSLQHYGFFFSLKFILPSVLQIYFHCRMMGFLACQRPGQILSAFGTSFNEYSKKNYSAEFDLTSLVFARQKRWQSPLMSIVTTYRSVLWLCVYMVLCPLSRAESTYSTFTFVFSYSRYIL